MSKCLQPFGSNPPNSHQVCILEAEQLRCTLDSLQQKGSQTSILDSSDRQSKKKKNMKKNYSIVYCKKNNQIIWYSSNAS